MKTFRKILAAVLMVGLLLSFTGCTSNVGLFINAKKGDSYKYNVVMKSTTDITAQGQTVKTVQDMNSDYSVKVDDIDTEGNLSMSYTFDAIKVDVDANGTKQTIDSKNPDKTNPLSNVYNGLIGKGFSAKMTKYGEVKEVKGLDAMLDSIINSLDINGDANAAAVKEQMKNSLKQSFGDEAIISSLEQSTKIFPKGDIKVGDTWENSLSLNSIIKIDMTMKYMLYKVEKGIAYVSVNADIKTDNSKPANIMGIEANVDLKGTMTGAMRINIDNGFIGEGEMTQSLDGKMSLDNAQTGKMEIPIKLSSETKFNTVKQ